jgi:arylformamidase
MNNPSQRTKTIDVSVNLSPNTPVWPGAPRYQLVQNKVDLGGGEVATSSHINMIPHCGTHIDAPLHFIRDGKAVDALDFDLLIGPCRVLEHRGDRHITKDDLMAMGFVPSQRILIKSHNSIRLRNGTLDENFLSLLPEALDHLIQSGVKVLGVDGFSIGPMGEMTTRNHLVFCRTGGIIIEVLDLLDVEPGEYGLIALPIKLEGVEGAPARVVLVRPEDASSLLQ